MAELSNASMERILRNAGAKRVSKKALEELSEHMEEYGLKLSKEAVALAKHAGRITIKKEDIKLTAKKNAI